MLHTTDLKEAKLLKRGKVRDVYELEDKLLFIATDRISAFDVVLPTPIPDKGKILTQISLFWFEYLSDICENHIISSTLSDLPAALRNPKYDLAGRFMIVKKANVIPFECVVRGYISGSGWKEYKTNGTICGIKLPQDLLESQKLPEPIFTPATKAEIGHDENVDFNYMKDKIGLELAAKLRDLSLSIYKEAASFAENKGIIIADTKFEFGLIDGQVILIDEVLTPDSSRFWPKDIYKPGGSPASFDKQFVRDYLETLDWNKQYPGPVLPESIVKKTQDKYKEALKVLAGKTL
jgi:phosphoribosylaminoimidazole-succinocarboxamide synthase